MTQPAIDEGTPESAQAPSAAEVWEKVHNEHMKTVENPISKEDVRGDKEPEKTAPERSLVAPEIAQWVQQNKQPEPNPFDERLSRIEQALTPQQQEEQKRGIEDEVRELRELLLQKEQQEAEARLEAEREQRRQLFRDGVISNLQDAKDEFPFLTALGMEEKVFETLLARLEAGEEVSEYDVASEAEAKYADAYERMMKAKQPTTSEEPGNSESPKEQPTLTPTLSASDEPTDIGSILESAGGDRKQAAAQLWDAIMKE